jgi:hypothetical protein
LIGALYVRDNKNTFYNWKDARQKTGTMQLHVHFEIEHLGNMCVKQENVRIVFELPDIDA